jgi:hypothetical protein
MWNLNVKIEDMKSEQGLFRSRRESVSAARDERAIWGK